MILFSVREELKEQLEKKKKGSRALADFEDKMNDVRLSLFMNEEGKEFYFIVILFLPIKTNVLYFTHFFPEMEKRTGKEPREADRRRERGEEGEKRSMEDG